MALYRHILLADAGSTKTEWRLIGRKGETKVSLVTPGINALVTADDLLCDILDQVKLKVCGSLDSEIILPEYMCTTMIEPSPIDEIHFYGAGCATNAAKERIRENISSRFPSSLIGVESDLVAAARAVCGKTAGVACILGTGSNSCLYDGRIIAANTPPMGYVLGDEGSGTAIGRRMISDAFKHLMPEETTARFMELSGATLEEIVSNVYSKVGTIKTAPNAYIASFAKIASQMIDDQYIRNLVKEEFKSFISRNIMQYRRVKSLKIGFVGSIAVNFADLLKEVLDEFGFKMGKILDTPMDGLARHHSRTSL